MDNLEQTLPGMKNKHVSFNLTPNVIYEPAEISQDLQKCRLNNFMQRKADAARLERLLSPILSPEHRYKIWKKIHT
jgi:hypothetical protein